LCLFGTYRPWTSIQQFGKLPPSPDSPAHLAFGDAIRAIRKEQGISQEALALKCGLDRSYYGAVERGERNVSLTNIVRIADARQTRPAAVFARAEAAEH
jgi:transcriptional regulator with XRE-family HTH domain